MVHMEMIGCGPTVCPMSNAPAAINVLMRLAMSFVGAMQVMTLCLAEHQISSPVLLLLLLLAMARRGLSCLPYPVLKLFQRLSQLGSTNEYPNMAVI